MRKRSPKLPKPQEYRSVKMALESYIPMDEPLQVGWRESLKLVPNIRLSSVTYDIRWSVDLYSGGYYYAQVGGFGEPFKSIPPLISYLLLHLNPR
jgi:hypothetical protein